MDTPDTPPSANASASGETGRAESAPGVEVPDAKTERIAGMRHELADLQRHLLEAEQRIAHELQGRAEDADRFEELENRMHAQAVENSARIAELTFENESVRGRFETATDQLTSQISSLREQLAAREAELAAKTAERDTDQTARQRLQREIEELQGKHRELSEQLASTATERETFQSTRSQLEGERDAALGKQRELTEQLDRETSSLREATASLAGRDAELTTRTSERDALQATKTRLEAELEETRRALEGGRTKAQELAKLLTSFGQDMLETVVATDPRAPQTPRSAVSAPASTKPPPIPGTRPTANPRDVLSAVAVERQKPPARLSGLVLMVGVAAGVLASVAVVQFKGPQARATATKPQESGWETPTATPAPNGDVNEPSTEPATVASLRPDAPADTTAVEQPDGVVAETGEPLANAQSTGIIVLPKEADGRRIFVDGHRAVVKNRRVEVPCGKHELQIGSQGEQQELDVACERETELR